jgi:hypothetical protein
LATAGTGPSVDTESWICWVANVAPPARLLVLPIEPHLADPCSPERLLAFLVLGRLVDTSPD